MAVNHHWCRFPGSSALDTINDIRTELFGMKMRLNKGCSHCIMELMTDVGRIYLADLAEKERTKVAVIDEAAPVVKAEVKVTRKRTRKPKEA